MRKLLSISILILVFCTAVFAQTNQTLPCPKIEVFGSEGITRPGEAMTFTVKVQGYDTSKLIYEWSVSKGSIIEGQGTSVIVVSPKEDDSGNITATVEIKNLPEGCNNKDSDTAPIPIREYSFRVITEYEKLPFNKEKNYLDLIGVELRENPDSGIIFMIYFSKEDSISVLKIRVRNIKNYLTKKLLVPEHKFKFEFSQMGIYLTKIWISNMKDFNSIQIDNTTLEEIEAQRKNQQ